MDSTLTLLLLAMLLGVARCLDCTGKEDGVYEKSCQSVGKCYHGKYVHYNCAQHEAVDFGDDYKCKKMSQVQAPCNKPVNCKNTRDGSFSDGSGHCGSYYTCYRGVFLGRNFCPGELYFNEAKQVCDFRDNVNCS